MTSNTEAYVYVAGIKSQAEFEDGKCYLFRLPAGHPKVWALAEWYTRNQEWIKSDLLDRYYLRGSTDLFDPIDITAEQAEEVIRKKRERLGA